MSKELEYLYSNKNIPETQLQRQIRKALAAKEKLYEQRESALEAHITAGHKERLSQIPIADMSFSDVSLLDEINKADREPKHYYDVRKTQNQAGDEFHDPNHNNDEELEKFNQSYNSVKELMQKIQMVPGLDRYEGVTEKLSKCNQILQMLEKISESGFDTGSINKIMKGYTRPACCTMKKSGRYIKKSDDNFRIPYRDYVIGKDGSQYKKSDLLEARREIDNMISDMNHFDQL